MFTVHRIGTSVVLAYNGLIIAHSTESLDPDVIERLLRKLVQEQKLDKL